MKKPIILILILIVLAFACFKIFSISNVLKVNNIVSTGKLIEKHNLCDIYLHDQNICYLWKEYPNLIDSNMFFLHVYAVDSTQLPEARKVYGFDNLDFKAMDSNILKTPYFSKNKITVIKAISAFKIKKIQTGMYNERERVWESKIIEF